MISSTAQGRHLDRGPSVHSDRLWWPKFILVSSQVRAGLRTRSTALLFTSSPVHCSLSVRFSALYSLSCSKRRQTKAARTTMAQIVDTTELSFVTFIKLLHCMIQHRETILRVNYRRSVDVQYVWCPKERDRGRPVRRSSVAITHLDARSTNPTVRWRQYE